MGGYASKKNTFELLLVNTRLNLLRIALLQLLLEMKLPYEPSCPSVGRMVGLSVSFTKHAPIGALDFTTQSYIRNTPLPYFLDLIIPTVS